MTKLDCSSQTMRMPVILEYNGLKMRRKRRKLPRRKLSKTLLDRNKRRKRRWVCNDTSSCTMNSNQLTELRLLVVKYEKNMTLMQTIEVKKQCKDAEMQIIFSPIPWKWIIILLWIFSENETLRKQRGRLNRRKRIKSNNRLQS